MKKFSDAEFEQAVKLVFESMSYTLSELSEEEAQIPSGFKERILRLSKRREQKNKILAISKKIAIIFLVFLFSAGIFLSINPEVRAYVREWMRETYNNLFLYRYFKDAEVDTQVDYTLTWLPDGFELVSNTKYAIDSMSIYMDDNGNSICFQYLHFDTGGLLALYGPTDKTNQENIEIDGVSAEFYHAIDPTDANNLVWTDASKEITFVVSGTVDKETLLLIAKSVSPINK